MSQFNYFEVITVDVTDFPEAPQVAFGFNSQGIILLNRGTGVVEYSFDGVNVHGDLNPDDASVGAAFDGRVESKIFFRAASTETVRVEAWAA